MAVVGIGKVSAFLKQQQRYFRGKSDYETISMEIKQDDNGFWNLKIGDKEYLCEAITVAITNTVKNRHLFYPQEIEDPMAEAYHQENFPYFHLEIMNHRQKVIVSLKKAGVDSSVYTTMVKKFSLVTQDYIYNGNSLYCTMSYNYLSQKKKVTTPKMEVLV